MSCSGYTRVKGLKFPFIAYWSGSDDIIHVNVNVFKSTTLNFVTRKAVRIGNVAKSFGKAVEIFPFLCPFVWQCGLGISR